MSIFYSPFVDLRHGAVLLLSNPLSVQQSEIFKNVNLIVAYWGIKSFTCFSSSIVWIVLAIFTEPHNHIWSRTQIPHCL